ncbi:MAG: alpha-L-fucosidase [Candidatus Latescibacterota bacterium]
MSELEEVGRRAAQIRPSPRQVAWQRLEYAAFAHFGMNTYTDREWGEGSEDPGLFCPTAFDADQWAQGLRQAGMRLLILTAKHHDGFCLWPSACTDHSVRRSPWRGGQGDVVGEVAAACRRAGLRFGVYCSPWDRHEPTYGDSPAYNAFFRGQLQELLTGYGELAEVWLDGACGEGPNGRQQEYAWETYCDLVRQLQPGAVIAICGPDVRWVGNESGLARQDEWSVLAAPRRPESPQPDFLKLDLQAPDLGSRQQLGAGEALVWYPAECDVSIRPGWFYHAAEDLQAKSLDQLLDIYYRSVGRNGGLLLNVPPDRRGLLHEHDLARLQEVRRVLDATFGRDLALGCAARADSRADADHGPERAVDGLWDTWWQAAGVPAVLELDLGALRTFDRLQLREPVEQGQRIELYVLEAQHQGEWKPVTRGGSVGHRRLDRFGRVSARHLRLRLEAARAAPALRMVGVHLETGR